METNSEELERKESGRSPASARWLGAVLVVLALMTGWIAYAQHTARKELTAQLRQANDKLGELESRTATLEDNYATLQGNFEVTSERLGLTQKELARARAVAQQIREEQRRASAQLGSQLEEQQTQLGSLSGEVTAVRGEVAQTQETLAETQTTLQRTIGDLGMQSGLIAHNQEELEELKARGERNYFEFDLRKSKQYTRVGPVSLRLRKTDTKRQKFTLDVLANDKRVEKKDKTLLEPVQFYVEGTRHLLEVVAFQVEKNRIVGYISVPKELAVSP
ncbi:hypothetical protein MYX77_07320 [Acidobacteriia bacterium AH_259_A11_L15]|nr:hypothetical protein [Acidobacteriia bacterium AH_259_A11_L15]